MREPLIYLDHNATTPLHPTVWEAMRPFLTDVFGNPSSLHSEGRQARDAVEEARQHVARLLGASAEEILFTSGGTEADNKPWKLKGFGSVDCRSVRRVLWSQMTSPGHSPRTRCS
jgi:cysteine desulfurase